MSAAILCPAVCVSDVINKASMCDKRFKDVTGQPFSALNLWRASQDGYMLPEEPKLEATNKEVN